MKTFTAIILLSLFMPALSLAQKNIKFDITYGSYINDHKKSEFHLKERTWSLKKGELIFKSIANNTIYSDTVTLSKDEIIAIENYILENELHKSITKDLTQEYLNKRDWKASMKGNVKLHHKNISYNIIANSPTLLNEDDTAQLLIKFEELLDAFLSKHL